MKRKTDSGHYIGKEFPSQKELTKNYSKIIRQIYRSDILSPEEQQKAVMSLSGITRDEMEAIIKTSGPELASSIREIISKGRA